MKNLDIVICSLALFGLFLSTPVHGADVEGSSDHPMLTRFPGAEIADYDQRYHDLGWIPAGEDQGQWVAGHLTWIVYNGPQGHSTLEIYRNYENALAQGGFEISFSCNKDDCGRHFIRDLLDATGRMVGGSERWMPGSERHLSAAKSNDDDRQTWINLTAYERDAEGAVRIRLEIIEANSPRPLEELGGEFLAGNSINYDEASLAAGPAERNEITNVIDLEGRIDWRVVKYPVPASAYEAFSSTRNWLRQQGYTIDFQCHFADCGGNFVRELLDLNDHPLPGGESWSRESAHYLVARKSGAEGMAYVSAAGYAHPDGYAKLRRLEVETTELEFNLISVTGETMADELDASGKVAVYGIYFDTDSATLKSESDQTLEEIARLLRLRPEFTLYVDGHTDSEGEDAYNLDLSTRRAQAVVAWLIGKGIAENRLEARGFGEAEPVADNATEQGRAWNRRVELVAR